MPVTVKHISLWRKEIENHVGTLAKTLDPVAKAGANLRVFMGYRYPGNESPRGNRTLSGCRQKSSRRSR